MKLFRIKIFHIIFDFSYEDPQWWEQLIGLRSNENRTWRKSSTALAFFVSKAMILILAAGASITRS